nr:polyprenol phosphomannose-dependent alpha 1,6 mannosyltransferase MptB [Actinomadura rayongensis]
MARPRTDGATTTRRRAATGGLVLGGTGLACVVVVAFLGPSAFEPALPGGGPPFALAAHPSPYLVVALVVAGLTAGAAGLALCLRAAGEIPVRPLLVAGLLTAAVLAFLPPVGSSDHLNYAGYGRMAVTGHDPYATTADDVPGDPVAGAAEEWRRTPSVYGPVATAGQAFASWIGGDSLRRTVFVLSAMNVLAFALTALLLHRMARDDKARTRAALLWTANPLVLYQLVAGAHNDVWAIAPMVAALAVFARPGRARTVLTGVLVAVGAAVKLPAALVGGGPAWLLLRHRRAGLVALFGGAGVTAAVLFALAGPHVFDQTGRAGGMISLATPWHLVRPLLGRDVIKYLAAATGIALALLLYRGLPTSKDVPRDDPRRVAAALLLGWLFTAPYVLPWYDGYGWALLALLPLSRFDAALLVHTLALSVAYLPARKPELIGLPDGLTWLFTTLRPDVIPCVLTIAALTVAALCARRSPGTESPQRSSAAP